jgi:hypothetical protein
MIRIICILVMAIAAVRNSPYGVGDYRMSLVSAKRTIWLFLKGTP